MDLMGLEDLLRRISPPLLVIQEVCNRHYVQKLAVFGSIVTDRKTSKDVDILVIFHAMEPVQYVKEYFGLETDLEKFFNLPIDLVEEQAIRNPIFRKIIEETSVEIYAST